MNFIYPSKELIKSDKKSNEQKIELINLNSKSRKMESKLNNTEIAKEIDEKIFQDRLNYSLNTVRKNLINISASIHTCSYNKTSWKTLR